MAFISDVTNLKNALNYLSDADRLKWEELIDLDTIETREISSVLDFKTGVKVGEKVGFIDKQQGYEFMKDASGLASNCDDISCDVGITTSTKEWNPNRYTCSIEECFKDIDPQVRDYFNSYKSDRDQTEGSAYVSFLTSLIEDSLRKSHWVKSYFADAASANGALSGFNGLFNQYASLGGVAGSQGPSGTIQRLEIVENAGASYNAQQIDTQNDDIIDRLDAHFHAFEDNRYLTSGSATHQITEQMAKAYLRWLRRNKQVMCCERDPQTGQYDLNNLSFYGYNLEVVREWDEVINTNFFNNGTVRVAPNRILSSVRPNQPIGTCFAERLGEVRFKYDDYTERFKLTAEYDMDAQISDERKFVLSM